MMRGRRAAPRRARYQYWRGDRQAGTDPAERATDRVTLVGTIEDGPATEIGRLVHLVITLEELDRVVERVARTRWQVQREDAADERAEIVAGLRTGQFGPD